MTKTLYPCLITLFSVISLWAENPPKLVFLYGAKSHRSGDHEFKAGSHLLANHLNRQDAVPVNAIVHPGWPEDESILDDAAAVIIYSDATKVIGNGWDKMEELMAQGVGCMLMHYAVHPTIEEGEEYFIPWIGGYFKNGKSVNPFWKATIEPNPDHETCCGIEPFTAIDEFYFNIEYSERMIPIGTATPTRENLQRINNIWTQEGYEAEGTPQHLLWGIERPDGGRGAGFTGGHHHKNWALDDYRQIVLNTIVWIAGQEVPEGGVPTATVTEDELNENLDDYGDKTNRILLPDPNPVIEKPGQWWSPAERAALREEKRRLREEAKKKKQGERRLPSLSTFHFTAIP